LRHRQDKNLTAYLQHSINLVNLDSYLFAGKYTIFAHVIDGMDVLEKMERTPTGIKLPNSVCVLFLSQQWASCVQHHVCMCVGVIPVTTVGIMCKASCACVYVIPVTTVGIMCHASCVFVCVCACLLVTIMGIRQALYSLLTSISVADSSDKPSKEIRLKNITIHANPVA
jgi:hypothetical protein